MSHITCERVWSLTPFWNELDVLAIRLAELDSVVDTHVVSEATFTYAGNAKPTILADAIESGDERIAPYAHKIEIVTVQTTDVDYLRPPTQGLFYPAPDQIAAWQRENAQRRALMRVVPKMNPHDIVLLSDVDEIPRASVIRWYDEQGGTYLYRPPLAMHVGALNWRWANAVPVICRLFRAQMLQPAAPDLHDALAVVGMDTEQVRNLPGTDYASSGDDPAALGWHLSYMGGVDAMRDKLLNAAHPEMATPDVLSAAHLERVLQDGDELFGRERGVHWVPNTTPLLPAAAGSYPHLTVPRP